MQAAPPPLPTSIVRGRYRVAELVGRGGVGAVYRALDLLTSEWVAVKQLVARAPGVRARFERESRLLDNLRHASIPRSHGWFIEAGEPLLLMQFVPGLDLGERLAQRVRPFGVRTVLEWASQLLEVLIYLHARGVVHHDVKPRNIKLDEAGRVVLLDFGLAREGCTDAIHDGPPGYTAAYSPPEQVVGARTDARSDLYSVGATMYELLALRSPPPALERVSAVRDGRSDPLLPLELRVPASVAATVHAALELEPNGRPLQARTMHAALRQALTQCRDGLDGESALEEILSVLGRQCACSRIAGITGCPNAFRRRF
ncbi:MAG: serine/threonine protein kinase [Chloroflexi bacterium]|nr:serine/threonine protein kinase [Chloroflexota bacterium]